MEIHGSSLKKETVEAIRIVKDSILKYGSILDIPVTKEMAVMGNTSRQLYMNRLHQKRKKEEKAKEEATLNVGKNESEKCFAQEQNIEFQNIESTLVHIHCGFKAADESVLEGNAELKDILLKENSTRKELQKA